jgi:tRNA U55 pseudouridine synthase TruB
MSHLTRTAIGSFCVEHANAVEALNPGSIERFLLPPIQALQGFPSIQLTTDQAHRIVNGRFLDLPNHGIETFAAAVDSAHELIAIVRPHGPDELRPELVFRSA